ncbi:MAG: BON domain-containing protein [Planctomycetaceae bacterium]|nr:BON domain-containing protein [Planctomycetaceae bacterium]
MSQTPADVHKSLRSVLDDEITKQQLENTLATFGYFLQTDISIEYHNSVAILHGRVGSYHEKQRAQELARRIDGVALIINRLLVDRDSMRCGQTG